MFGHDDNQQQPAQDDNSTPIPMDGETGNGINTPAPPHHDTTGPAASGPPTMSAPHVVQSNFSAPSTGTPADEPAPSHAPHAPAAAPSNGGEDLLNLKQQALQHLSPLVGQLDQTPEEKFRTTMMMIQASDDKSLVKTAFEAAQAITDDKARAQALLDIINEINYFTQHQQ